MLNFDFLQSVAPFIVEPVIWGSDQSWLRSLAILRQPLGSGLDDQLLEIENGICSRRSTAARPHSSSMILQDNRWLVDSRTVAVNGPASIRDPFVSDARIS